MDTATAKQSRLARTRSGLQALHGEISEWLARRRGRDIQQKFNTQLDLIEGTLQGATRRLESELKDDLLAGGRAELYAACRQMDLRNAWIRRLFGYFRAKFDQRDDPKLSPLLDGADEMIWSCHAPAWKAAVGKVPAAPLAYIEPLFSPRAIPKDDPPPELETQIDAPFLKEFLAALPVPVIALPTSCLGAPWWLVVVAHECGHHLQRELEADLELVKRFADELRAAIEPTPEGGADPSAAERWARWGQEIFADVYSVLCTGRSALSVVAEFEWAEDAVMTQRRSLYPAPLVRLALMAETLHQLLRKLPAPAPQADAADLLGPELARLRSRVESQPVSAAEQQTAVDLALTPRVAAAALSAVVKGPHTLKAISGWDLYPAGPGAKLSEWAKKLRSQDSNLYAPPEAASARRIVAAGFESWQEAPAGDDASHETVRSKLAKAVLDNLQASRDIATRAGPPPGNGARSAPELGQDLAERLLHLSWDELEARPQRSTQIP